MGEIKPAETEEELCGCKTRVTLRELRSIFLVTGTDFPSFAIAQHVASSVSLARAEKRGG